MNRGRKSAIKKKGQKKRRAVVLLSGGMDSATTLYVARKRGYRCFCLIFDYGQRHRKEIGAARNVAREAGCEYEIIKIRLPEKGSSLLDKKLNLPRNRFSKRSRQGIPSTYVPGRNTLFLSFALSWAEALEAGAIFVGAHCRDYSGYPDCRPEYFRAFRRVVTTGTRVGQRKEGIRIAVPLLNKNKSEIIKLGTRLRVPYELTWSCYQGGKSPCRRCDACILRRKGFKKAGVEDPLFKIKKS